jgi:exodeoxyribonuclease VII small subunit
VRRISSRFPQVLPPYSFYPIFGGQNRDTIALGVFLHLAKFEDCLQRLEKIVQELEKGEVPLEKSLTLFEEGMKLSSSCRKELEEAEGKVEILLKQNGKLQAEPFESLTEKTPARG